MSYSRQAEPEDIILNLWMALASGAKGVGLWQYRPEYKTFEAPGYSLVAPDGSATNRLSATAETIEHLNSISEHLPIHTTNAEVAILYDEDSSVMFSLGSRGSRSSRSSSSSSNKIG